MNRREFLRRSLYLGCALGLPAGATAKPRHWPDIRAIMATGPQMQESVTGYYIPMVWRSRNELIAEGYTTE